MSDTPAPYRCQIAAKPCPAPCDSAQCAPEPVAVPDTAPKAHRIDPARLAEMRAGLSQVPAPIWFKMQVLDLIIVLTAITAELQQAQAQLAAGNKKGGPDGF